MFKTVLLTWLLLLGACAPRSNQQALPQRLPIPVANNAVAYLNIDGQDQYYTFNGLTAGKTYQDITQAAYLWQAGDWQQLQTPDSQLPVLASTAVTVGEAVYLFGGYTVAADHSEKSVPNVWRIDGRNLQWEALPAMPTPVDDTVALVYQDRFIYLISGWHDVDNVDLVQVFDTEQQNWQQATAFPLPPVFGHAGAIIGQHMLVCDGVKVMKNGDKKQFLPSPVCAMGVIDASDHTQIDWQTIDHHSGTAYYRMAAASDKQQRMYFAAGSDNPYNYDGVGYNQVPSDPSSAVRIFDLKTQQWTVKTQQLPASMDHRALLNTPHGLVIMGGMGQRQRVLDRIIYYKK